MAEEAVSNAVQWRFESTQVHHMEGKLDKRCQGSLENYTKCESFGVQILCLPPFKNLILFENRGIISYRKKKTRASREDKKAQWWLGVFAHEIAYHACVAQRLVQAAYIRPTKVRLFLQVPLSVGVSSGEDSGL